MRLALPLALVLAGCGSATLEQLPPPAGPARAVATLADGRQVELLGRERAVELRDGGRRIATAPAGIGPTAVACLPRRWCYVADARGDAVLVYAVGAKPDALKLDPATDQMFVGGGQVVFRIDLERFLSESR